MSNPTTVSVSAIGTSTIFSITPQEFLLHYYTQVSPVSGDFISPPSLGAQGGPSQAFQVLNNWYPWIDEKLCEAKYDGVCQWLGIASNRPTYIKDYHMIALNRAVDYILKPTYLAFITATVTGPAPKPPPTT